MINTKFMNKIKKILIFTLIAGFAFNTNAQDQGTVSQIVATTATVITPITISTPVAMNFGTMSVNALAGTLVLSTDGSLSPTGGVDVIGAGGIAGRVSVEGKNSSNYTVTVRETIMLRVSGNQILSEISGSNVMPLSAITLDNNTAGSTTTTTAASYNNSTFTGATAVFAGEGLSAAGASQLKIGATITLAAAQAVGVYTGEITVDVAYD
jgi:hypothetical protein